MNNAKITENSQFKQGYLYAVRLLTASKKSESEVVKRLRDKGYGADSTGQVVEELKKNGVLDDQKLITETIQWASQAKRHGRKRIFFDLKKRGIAASKIEQALEDYAPETERQIALSLAQDRWDRLSRVEPQKRKKRLYDFLINRGFAFELSREVVNVIERNAPHENI